MSSIALTVVVLIFGLWLVYGKRFLLNRKYTLPPGPPQRFFSGNIHQIPRGLVWKTFTEWKEKYGPLVYYRVYTEKLLVINSPKVALDLLEQRSGIYSDRPRTVMAGELCKRQTNVFRMPYDHPHFKEYRRMMNSGMNSRVVKKYEPLQEIQTCIMLKSLLETPEKFGSHLRMNSAALVLKLVYGYSAEVDDDEFVQTVEKALIKVQMLLGSVYIVDYFPFLKYLPSWFPFAPWKKIAQIVRQDKSEWIAYLWAKDLIASGDYRDSFTSLHLRPEGGPMVGDDEQEKIMHVSSALFLGGADTTVSAMTTLVYLMATHPEVLKKVQTELDSIVGTNRLPKMSDMPNLPYLGAVIKEVLRWNPPAPISIQHRVMEDDIYENYFIPKGTTLVPNIWAMTHDPETYPNPERFDPERHLGVDPQVDPYKFLFGFGRRVCPGQHLAEVILFLSAARVLYCFDIKKPLDANGKEIDPHLGFRGSPVCHLEPFECRVLPRSENVVEMIKALS